MALAMEKDDKFEIVAIIREALLRKTKLELKYKNSSLITRVIKVDYDYFVISRREGLMPGGLQYFILHSDNGIIRFDARFYKTLMTGSGHGLAFFIPETIVIVQRRQQQRFAFSDGYPFYCSGRYKNGENYALRIKNISRGGCALLTKSIHPRFLRTEAMIKGARLDFGAFGDLQLDLKVVAVVALEEFDENSQLYSCYQISCQFIFRNSREESEVEKVILHFLMSNKPIFL